MLPKSFRNIDEAYTALTEILLTQGELNTGRGGSAIELLNVGVQIQNPRARVLTNPARAISRRFAAGELAWHLSGSKSLAFISHYSKSWLRCSDDGHTITGSCYGHSIFTAATGSSQYRRLIDLLTSNPSSRRAVLILHDSQSGLAEHLQDVACTVMLQCFVRRGALHATVYMRSNDMMYGFPYDVFLFTVLQEMIATDLGLPLGTYTHFAGSLHIYEKHFELFKRIADTKGQSEVMPAMTTTKDLSAFLLAEANARHQASQRSEQEASMSSFWQTLVNYLGTPPQS